ncbi:MAG: hypothetical protein ACR2MR_00550 [Dietzia maris]
MGSTTASGLVASAVAGKVGSSMSWHMVVTSRSPIGSTSMRAPQWSSQNSPLSWSVTEYRKSMNSGGAPTSSWKPLKISATPSPVIDSASFMRRA